MQIVKLISPADAQLAFFAVHSASALLVAVFLDRTAGAFLSVISLLYLAHLFGFTSQQVKVISAEILFILAMIVGGINGNTGTLMGLGDYHWPNRFGDYLMGRVTRIKLPEKVYPQDQGDV